MDYQTRQYIAVEGRPGLRIIDMARRRRRVRLPPARFFFDGVEYTATHKYIIHDKLNATVTHSDGPRPVPMPGGQEWYEVANCYGEIHDSGF